MRLMKSIARNVLVSSMIFVCTDVLAAQKFGFHQSCDVLDIPLNINVIFEVGDKNANYGVNVIYKYSDSADKQIMLLYPQMPAFSSIKNDNSGILCANGCGYATSPFVDYGMSKYNKINSVSDSGSLYALSVRTASVNLNKDTNVMIPTRRLALLRIEGFIMPGSLGAYERNQYTRMVGVYGPAFYEPLIIEYVETSTPGVMRLSQSEYGNSRNKSGYPTPDNNLNVGQKNLLKIRMKGSTTTGWFDVASTFESTQWSVIPDCAK